MSTETLVNTRPHVLRASRSEAGNASPEFCTARLGNDLRGRCIRGGIITFAAQGIRFAVQMATTMVLARLLTPADFGLVAMVTAVTGFVSLFKDMGLSTATIQRAQITHDQVSMLFWLNVAISAVLVLVVCILSPFIAGFYGDERLVLLTIAVGGTFILGGLSAQHYALLVRQMRFAAMAYVQSAGICVGAATGIGLAVAGWGYWALVAMGAAQALVTAIMAWVLVGWRPGLPRRDVGAWELCRFGGALTCANLLNYLSRNVDKVLLGWWWGAPALGFYSKAYSLLALPMQQLNAPLNGVVLPALARLQEQPVRYRRYYVRAVGLVAFAGIPAVVFACVYTELLVLTILGDQWLEAVAIFRALAPAALFGAMGLAPAWAFTSLGRSDLLLRWAAVSCPLVICGFFVALPMGPVAVGASFSITFGGMFVATMVHVVHMTGVSASQVLLACVRPLVAAGLASLLATGGMALAPTMAPPSALLGQAVLFAPVYIALSLAMPGGRTLILDVVTPMRTWRTQKG